MSFRVPRFSLRLPQHVVARYLLAGAIVAGTTVVRSAADPYLHGQLPYMFYVGAVGVIAWACGVDAAILGTVVAAFTANYFFVPARYEFTPHQEDWRAMGIFSAVALTVASVVWRSRLAERVVRDLHAQTAAVLEQMRAATLAAEVGIWTWEPATNRISVAANWRELFGVVADADVTFATWVGALHPADRDRAVGTLDAAWVDGREFSTEYRVIRPDGTVRWLVDRGRAFRDATGKVAGMAGINVDITERKVAEEAMCDANRMKDEFLATLSHELRTPLNAIMGWSDMLRRGGLPPDSARRAADSIYRNAKVQNELINDVLDVSRIVSGKVRIERRPIDLVALLHAALEAVRSAAEAKGLEIVTDFAPVPFPLVGDGTRIQQVFWNLLANAVKFTLSGGRVRVRLRFIDNDVEVKVADTGIGISAEFLPQVFERFRQHDSSSTRAHGGLGLGLSIVRHLVELHGGTVKAESPGEGHGATFTVRLPGRPFEDRRMGEAGVRRIAVAAIEPSPDEVPSLCGVRVLVVDDEPDAREMTASVLQHHGATVTLAENAAQALAAFDNFDADVLLFDIAMPDVDGYSLIRRVRGNGGRKAAVPAIALTAYARDEDEHRALSSGFQRHLAKPVDSHTLVRSIADVLAAHRREMAS